MIHAVIYDVINNFQDGPGEAFEGGRATFPDKAQAALIIPA